MTDLLSSAAIQSLEQIQQIGELLRTLPVNRDHNHAIAAPSSSSTSPAEKEVEEEKSLSALGAALQRQAALLREEVESQLISFYEHWQKKESKEVEALAEQYRIVPEGFKPLPQCEAYTSAGELAVAERHNAEYLELMQSLKETKGEALFSSRKVPSQRHDNYDGDYGDGGATYDPDSAIVGGNRVQTIQKLKKNNAPTGGEGLTGIGTATATTSSTPQGRVNLTRTIADRKTASQSLQTYLYLLLESVCTACDATVAALYLSDAPTTDSTTTTTTAAAAQTLTTNTRTAPPCFLHRVAHVGAEGVLPSQLSFSTLHPLTLVVQTGTAVNFKDLNATASSHEGKGAQTKRPASHYSVDWNIRNGVVMPLQHYGCLVVADKRLSLSRPGGPQDSAGNSFSLLDEHTVWGAAGTIEALLQRYDRSVLIEYGYAPMTSFLQTLRQVSRISSIADTREAAIAEGRRTLLPARGNKERPQSKLLFESEEANQVYDLISGGKNFTEYYASTSPVSFPTSSSNATATAAQKSAWNEQRHRENISLLSRRIKIIRAADEAVRHLDLTSEKEKDRVNYLSTVTQVSRDLQQLQENGGSDGVTLHPVSSLAELSEEQVFNEVAVYLERLEVLWDDAIASKNAMQAKLVKYSNDVERGRSTIADLELKLKRANARIEQLESQKRKIERKQ